MASPITESNSVHTLVWRVVLVMFSASCLAATTPGPASTVGGPQLASSGLVVDYASPAAPRLPSVKASAFVVADAGTGAILAARDPHGRFLPASTLKVLTAVALIPALDPDATTVASRRAASAVPNVAGLIAGQRYTIGDLFTALLTISANDAAIALAEAAGSYGKGLARLNATAARLQADDTHAVNPNGLDAPGQVTSAYDLALIARQAVAMPAFLHYDQVRAAPFLVKPGKSETLFNQDSLLSNYPGGIGGKIGWTSAAGATYIGLARRGGVTLIVTLMHCPALTEIAAAEKLLNWGFAAAGKVIPAGILVPPLAAGGTHTRAARLRPGARADPAGPTGPRPPAIVAAMLTVVALLAIGLGIVVVRRRRTLPGDTHQ